ncbi:GvpL/GvpF family gas vesicle protein [bacterium]|nr:GvpL/GvpF family gas vesicle protein [bacterium]
MVIIVGKYIYGVINGSHTIEMEKPSASSKVRGDKGKGAMVYTIAHQDISAVVSNSPIVDYTCLSKDIVARRLIEHQMVNEGIMQLGYTILPASLGSFAVNENEVRDILNKGYNLIKETIEKITDKIEIDVCATWSDFAAVLKGIGDEEEIREVKEKLLACEKITITDQMKIGNMVKEALNRKREREAEEIHKALGAISQAKSIHELMDEKKIINTAFLIDTAKQKEFDARVEELDAAFNEGLNFRCIGPLPSYSFYTLKIQKIQFERIDWARKMLDLGDVAAKDEIKNAYQRLAASTHPDTNQIDMKKEFNDVNRAYKMLVDYVKACEQTDEKGEKQVYSFREKEVKKNAILVMVCN